MVKRLKLNYIHLLKSALCSFLRDFGKLLHLPAGLAVLSLPVILYFKEWFALVPFGIMAGIGVVVGQILYHTFKGSDQIEKGFSVMFVAFAWVIIPLLGTIPFFGAASQAPPGQYQELGVFREFQNSFFEAVSGFTGTGLTMIKDPTQIPYVLQWWRTLSEWIGGVGVIMLASLLLKLNFKDQNLYNAETRNWTIQGDDVFMDTVYKIWWLYVGYTIVSIVLYYIFGMPFWEALNHGMTALGTGGFSVVPDSFSNYSDNIKMLSVVIMITGAIAFKIHYLLIIKFDWKTFLKQTQLHFFLVFLVTACVILFFIHSEVAVIDLVFQAASALATCGLHTVDIGEWYMSPVFVLVILMILGANSGSTGGGIKTERFVWFFKGFFRNVKQAWDPKEGEAKVIYNDEPQEEDAVNSHIQQAANIVFLWLITLTIGTLLLSLIVKEEYSFHEVLFDTASALSNVGLSTGVTGPNMPAEGKYLLSFLMWLGRLEIMAVAIFLISPFYLFKKTPH